MDEKKKLEITAKLFQDDPKIDDPNAPMAQFAKAFEKKQYLSNTPYDLDNLIKKLSQALEDGNPPTLNEDKIKGMTKALEAENKKLSEVEIKEWRQKAAEAGKDGKAKNVQFHNDMKELELRANIQATRNGFVQGTEKHTAECDKLLQGYLEEAILITKKESVIDQNTKKFRNRTPEEALERKLDALRPPPPPPGMGPLVRGENPLEKLPFLKEKDEPGIMQNLPFIIGKDDVGRVEKLPFVIGKDDQQVTMEQLPYKYDVQKQLKEHPALAKALDDFFNPDKKVAKDNNNTPAGKPELLSKNKGPARDV